MRRALAIAATLLLAGCRRAPAPAPAPAVDAASAEPARAVAPASDADTAEARVLRSSLVDRLARGGVVRDPRVLEVMRAVPRHAFAPNLTLAEAYADRAQPIGLEQTISQPTVVGEMTAALELTGRERVLEIGTGSGYQAAILARLAKEVYTIELLTPLGEAARQRLARLGYPNVHVRIGDGYAGWPEAAPFDRVIVTAAPDEIPPALLAQLADGGVLVAPVGPAGRQELLRYRKRDGGFAIDHLAAVHFVPMVPGSAPR